MSIDVLKKQVKNGDIKSLYLFHGPEEYLKKYYLSAIEEIILDNGTRSLNKIVMEGKADIPEIIRNCETYPVFSKRKMVVVRDSGLFKPGEGAKKDKDRDKDKGMDKGKDKDKGRDDIDKFIDYIKNIPSFTCLVFYENEVDRRLKIYNAISKGGLVVEFQYQKPHDLARWVVKMVNSNGKEIDMETASILIERTGQEMTELINEVNKLIAYTGDKKTINREDVQEVCNASVKSRIFDLTDAIVEKDVAASIKLLNDMFALREPVPLIIHMIARQFRQMMEVKILSESGAGLNEVASRLKVAPFIAKKIQKCGERFSLRQLNQAITDIFECDVAIKTGKMKEKTAVELLVIKLSEKTGSEE